MSEGPKLRYLREVDVRAVVDAADRAARAVERNVARYIARIGLDTRRRRRQTREQRKSDQTGWLSSAEQPAQR